jgi:hypothetical protein
MSCIDPRTNHLRPRNIGLTTCDGGRKGHDLQTSREPIVLGRVGAIMRTSPATPKGITAVHHRLVETLGKDHEGLAIITLRGRVAQRVGARVQAVPARRHAPARTVGADGALNGVDALGAQDKGAVGAVVGLLAAQQVAHVGGRAPKAGRREAQVRDIVGQRRLQKAATGPGQAVRVVDNVRVVECGLVPLEIRLILGNACRVGDGKVGNVNFLHRQLCQCVLR